MVPTIIEREVEAALQEHSQVTVVADAGTGKTSLLHAQVLKAISGRSTGSEKIPIFIRLKDWNGPGSLTDFLRTPYLALPMWGELLLSEKIGVWLSQQYEQGKVSSVL